MMLCNKLLKAVQMTRLNSCPGFPFDRIRQDQTSHHSPAIPAVDGSLCLCSFKIKIVMSNTNQC